MTSFKDAFFDHYASTHLLHRKGEVSVEQFRGKSRTWQLYFGRFLPASRDARVVDIGCGRGSLVWWLQSLGYERTEGIDISQELIDAARAVGVKNVEQADLRKWLPARPSQYDVVFLRDVIEHFERADVLEILKLVREALKPGGIVVLQVPNAESPFFGRIRYGDFTHELAFTATSLAQVFNMLGMSEHVCYPAPPPLHGVRAFPRRVIWALAQGCYRLLLAAELGSAPRIVTQNLIGVARRPT